MARERSLMDAIARIEADVNGVIVDRNTTNLAILRNAVNNHCNGLEA